LLAKSGENAIENRPPSLFSVPGFRSAQDQRLDVEEETGVAALDELDSTVPLDDEQAIGIPGIGGHVCRHSEGPDRLER
jgi:hypothetical protein